MPRAFLSHSSFDKDFVENVYDVLGAGRCVFDARTFRKNCDLPEQIRDGLEDCDVYVLFLSSSALQSNWVTAELDVAAELRSRWKVRSVLVFQLDETKWDSLPAWTHRYVASCLPSPKQVALRIADEIRSLTADSPACYGRDEDVRHAVELLSEAESTPAYIYLSGPIGIGRRTLASEIYKSYYPHITKTQIEISVDQVDDLLDIYRRALGFSSNWRARDYKAAVDLFVNLSFNERATKLATLLRDISTAFCQVVIINVGVSALTEEGQPQSWFTSLTDNLQPADYPYILFISQRFLSGNNLRNGLFLAVEPINEKWSAFLFKVLIKKYQVSIPSREEQSLIETSVSGHPGLIVLVANHLRTNPSYKPNRTHNNIVRMVNNTTRELLAQFVDNNEERAKAIALFYEAGIISYAEILKITDTWPDLEDATSALIDAGFLVRLGSDYTLVNYLQRAAEAYSTKYKTKLSDIRRLLLDELESLGEGSFIPVQLLNSRIVEHILDGSPLQGYLSSLVLPSQQIRAARRRYDAQDYHASLKLARDAYDQSDKLSDNGRREAWRLIGLSGIRAPDDQSFEFFCTEYHRQRKSAHTSAIFQFGNGLKCRLSGNLRKALEWYKKVPSRHSDSHVYRELAYIYAFEHSFDDAHRCITKAHELAFGNPYILDILAMVLLGRYRTEGSSVSIKAIDDCLDQLSAADDREGTKFYDVRSQMRDVIINNDLATLQELFSKRRTLPLAAKVALLNMLSLKDKELQFNELRDELSKIPRDKKSPLAEIEIARIDIEHKCSRDQFSDAQALMNTYEELLTQKCCDDLNRLFPASKRKNNRGL